MTIASRMPTLYIPHGAGPCFFMDWQPPDMWANMAAWLRGSMNDLKSKPAAILMVSAHWEESRFTVGSAPHPGMLFDYSGFPDHTYRFKYPSPGNPDLAVRVRGLLSDAGLAEGADAARGYDHGMFIPLMLMAPDADIPVVQLSLRSGLDATEHAAAGRALEPLRDEGVFIIGSGMSYHNMRGYGKPASGPVSDRFDDWLTRAVAIADSDRRAATLATWHAQPDGRASHPREEHLIPLMVVAGSGGDVPGRRVFSDRVMEATISAFRFD